MLARVHFEQNQFKQAKKYYTDALSYQIDGYEKGHPLLLASLHKLGLCERELRNFTESEMHLKEAYSQATKAELAMATNILEDMIVLYQKWGRMDAVKRYKALKP